MAELEKHPYHSSNHTLLIVIEKPGTGIFLMKERSKLYRPHKEREKRSLSKRLHGMMSGSQDSKNAGSNANKRLNLGGGNYSEVPTQKQGDTTMKSGSK
jgi:hypothetical protein